MASDDPPRGRQAELDAALTLADRAARDYLAAVDVRRVAAREAVPEGAHPPLPTEGLGAAAALADLVRRLEAGSHASTGPRFFHYVVGGVTPAALGADWLASAYDQLASSASGSPVAVDLEIVATRWLMELFDLDPDGFTGVFTTGATMANVVGLAAARQWWGERQGVDVGTEGFAGLPRPIVLSGGFVHASVRKALSMLGFGRSAARALSSDNRGTLDLDALRKGLIAADDAPVVLIATAGEVNAGRFDPIDAMADLAAEFGAWLHVDGAFGLFARCAASSRALGSGIERADSIASDAHKWLNVPYDAGFAFVADRSLLAKSFRMVADYLPPAAEGSPRVRVPANLGPESSRRARALPVFATLLSAGRAGVAAMVERHLELAQHLARRVKESPFLELVDDVVLNVVPFRLAPPGVRRRDLDALNQRVGELILADGRVFVGTTRYRSVVCFRPAIANWRTDVADVDLLVDVVLELLETALAPRR